MDVEVRHRIQAGANAWRHIEGAMVDRIISRKRRGRSGLDSSVVPASTYGLEMLALSKRHQHKLQVLAGGYVEDKSSVCAISVIYNRTMILIIIIISLGKLLLSYIANTSRTHERTHAHTRSNAHAHTRSHPHPLPSLFAVSVCPTMTRSHGCAPPVRRWRDNVRSAIHSNKQSSGDSVFTIVWRVFRVYKNS